jgi:hypothetical protein
MPKPVRRFVFAGAPLVVVVLHLFSFGPGVGAQGMNAGQMCAGLHEACGSG